MNKTIIVAIVFLYVNSAISQGFKTPIEGIYGKDYIIVNYIDWGKNTISDYKKGTKTYTGHKGTDFVLSGFPQMENGVSVIAIDSGVVSFVHDGEPDRNTVSNTELGFGNFIAIRHPNKLFSYYAHLKKNSILVKVGASVYPGQKIAEVGSSGNSSDPHLHFELWYDSLFLIEPFAASCGTNNSYWEENIPYDTSFHVWESGLTDFIPDSDELKTRQKEKYVFNEQDSIIDFWALQYGLKKGDSTRLEWITPNGNLWFEHRYTYKRDWWYYYYSSYIIAPSSDNWGKWQYNYYYNDKLMLSGNFEVEKSSGISKNKRNFYYKTLDNHTLEIHLDKNYTAQSVDVFDISGKKLLHRKLNLENQFIIKLKSDNNNPKMYFIKIKHNAGYYNFKVIL